MTRVRVEWRWSCSRFWWRQCIRVVVCRSQQSRSWETDELDWGVERLQQRDIWCLFWCQTTSFNCSIHWNLSQSRVILIFFFGRNSNIINRKQFIEEAKSCKIKTGSSACDCWSNIELKKKFETIKSCSFSVSFEWIEWKDSRFFFLGWD